MGSVLTSVSQTGHREVRDLPSQGCPREEAEPERGWSRQLGSVTPSSPSLFRKGEERSKGKQRKRKHTQGRGSSRPEVHAAEKEVNSQGHGGVRVDGVGDGAAPSPLPRTAPHPEWATVSLTAAKKDKQGTPGAFNNGEDESLQCSQRPPRTRLAPQIPDRAAASRPRRPPPGAQGPGCPWGGASPQGAGL